MNQKPPDRIVKPKSPCGCDHEEEGSSLPRGFLVIASGILTGIGLILHWTHAGPGWLTIAAFAAATLAGGALVFPGALGALKRLRLDINVLMTVAVIGAWIIGDYAEAASVVFLFALSELLESWAAGRARRAVDALLKLSPPTALVRPAILARVARGAAGRRPTAPATAARPTRRPRVDA